MVCHVMGDLVQEAQERRSPSWGSPMVSYKGPITRSRPNFVNLVTYLDDKGAFGSLGGNYSHLRHKTSKLKISATRGGSKLS